VQDILRLLELVKNYGIADWITFDSSVVRGLAYYTGIVFEGFDRRGELRAICGGGRYDALLRNMAGGGEGDAVPAVGFGFGDAVIVELLRERALLPPLQRGELFGDEVQVLVYAMTAELRAQAVRAATLLRERALSVDLVLDDRKPKWVFQRADKMGTPLVVLIGDEEAKSNQVVLKDLRRSQQETVPFESLVEQTLAALNSFRES
jgi:histidyl-tRNA synthetase